MIKSFLHKGLADFFYDGTRKKISAKHAKKLLLILDLLDAAHEISDMNFPGSRLRLLEPKTDKRWAVSVSGNWAEHLRQSIAEDQTGYSISHELIEP